MVELTKGKKILWIITLEGIQSEDIEAKKREYERLYDAEIDARFAKLSERLDSSAA